jgi:hypothetical protein
MLPRAAGLRPSGRLLYAALAVLFIIAFAYQVRAVEQAFPQWFGTNFVQYPFLLDAEDQPHFTLQFVGRIARDVGLRDGDVPIAINEIPVESRSIYADILAASHPSESWKVIYRRSGETLHRNASLRPLKL